jgi:hypothetical protein
MDIPIVIILLLKEYVEIKRKGDIMNQDQIEDMIVMESGKLRKDLATAQDIIVQGGMDLTSPLASIVMSHVLAEIRSIRRGIENPTLFGDLFGSQFPLPPKPEKGERDGSNNNSTNI